LRLKRGRLAFLVVALAGALLWVLLVWEPQPPREHAALGLAQPPAGGDFVLQSWRGPERLVDLRGKVVLIYFGYTWCPDVCPTNLAIISKALEALPAEALERVQVLFVSVDPERDSTARLREYAGYFHPRILGLTGSPEEIRRVADQYGAAYRRAEPDQTLGYLVDHSAFTYLVAPDGRLVETLEHATPPPRILEAIRRWLPAGPAAEVK
jgi:protein SCO1